MKKIKKFQPKKVVRIVCKCGELQLKIYPYSNYRQKEGTVILPCLKCINKKTEQMARLKAPIAP